MNRLSALLLALLLGLAGCSSSSPSWSTTTAAGAIDGPAIDVDELAEQIHAKLGKSNRDIDKVASVRLAKKVITIKWAIDDNITGDLLKRGAMMDAVEILELVEESAIVYDHVRLRGTFVMVDIKGNESEDVVVDATYSFDELLGVNWMNFLTDNVWTLADAAKIHPEFRPES